MIDDCPQLRKEKSEKISTFQNVLSADAERVGAERTADAGRMRKV